MSNETADRFRALHDAGTFVMPNAWDVGSARLLETSGAAAIATTSSGLAAALGRADQTVALDEVADHVSALTGAIGVPLSVDAEDCYAADPEGIAATVRRLADAGAAGLSIEDYDPRTGETRELDVAVERVTAAVEAARDAGGLVVTARADAAIHGEAPLDRLIDRLVAYREAGADVVYAPGLTDPLDIARVVAEAGAPVNVLVLPGGPSVAELAVLGVRRISTGGGLAWLAYGAAVDAARELSRGAGLPGPGVDRELRREAFGG
jgi:2-methylisocitrate lyase-like PEP mutase family enzyme